MNNSIKNISKRTSLSLLFAIGFGTFSAVAAHTSTPLSVVQEAYRNFADHNQTSDDLLESSSMRKKFFTKDLVQALEQEKENKIKDPENNHIWSDPFCGCQDWDDLKMQDYRFQIVSRAPQKAVINVRPFNMNIILVHTKTGWKIYDVKPLEDNRRSLRQVLRLE